ncbi:DNA polymerase III subunit beta [Streptomyces sp. NPDC005483]|uniref:DNA polymerase III subunit beta n=1 Tax=Streptomyces sp. NPDC005483 TaxID=3154882 RepID=UPI0033B2328C
MKLRIDQKELADAARRAHRRLPTNPIAPILAGILVEATEDTVTLSGFDYETSTRAVLDAEILEPGLALVSGRLLADVSATFPAGLVDVVADEREVTVTAPGTTFALPAMPVSDYPALPEAPGAAGAIDGDLLAAAVGHAAQCTLPMKEAAGSLVGFTGVHVLADGDQLTVSASDRYRIVRRTLPWQPADDRPGELLIPAGEFAATVKQTAGHTVHLGFADSDGSVASLSTDTLTVTSRTIAGKFPDIAGFFPKPEAAAGSALVDTAELLAAVNRAALVIEDKNPINVTFGGGKVTVRGGGAGQRGSSELAANTDIDDFTIAFNPHYLASLLAPIEGTVRIWLFTSSKPVLIEPVDDPTYRAVCMPVRIK